MEYEPFRTMNFEVMPATEFTPDFSQTSEPAYASPISASWRDISPEMLELMHALATRFNRLG